MRRVMLAVVVLALVAELPSMALAYDFEDPNLFGPGEGWAPPPELAAGDRGYAVRRLQSALEAAGFRPGEIDGRYGAGTVAAVIAFEKAHGLDRDGIFTFDEWAYLDAPLTLTPSAYADRVEVDLEKQLLFLIRNQELETVVPISSGSGGTYRGLGGRYATARTPEGSFAFYRHVEGWRISYLGGLYEPYYFRGGYAIHGSRSVPPYPASHGCVRVRISDMDFLKHQLELGMPVFVYGSRLARADVVPPAPQPARLPDLLSRTESPTIA